MSTPINLEISPIKLKKARGKLKQAHVARMVGIHRQHLWGIEKGNCRPSADVLARLCALYGVEVSDLTRIETNGKRNGARQAA